MRLVILAEEPPAEVRAQLQFFDIWEEEKLYSFTRVYRVKAEPRILPFIRLAGIEPDEVGRALHPGDLVAWPLPERPGRKSRWIVMLAWARPSPLRDRPFLWGVPFCPFLAPAHSSSSCSRGKISRTARTSNPPSRTIRSNRLG